MGSLVQRESELDETIVESDLALESERSQRESLSCGLVGVLQRFLREIDRFRRDDPNGRLGFGDSCDLTDKLFDGDVGFSTAEIKPLEGGCLLRPNPLPRISASEFEPLDEHDESVGCVVYMQQADLGMRRRSLAYDRP